MRKKIRLIAIFLIAAISGTAFSTGQIPDLLVYKGETLPIFTEPLETFFSVKNPKPEDLFPETCSANWRGYLATWKIENNKLYLLKVVKGTCGNDAPEIDVSRIFNGRKLPVEAVWYTGIIKILRGKMLSYVHMGYESIYEKELLLKLENGKIVHEEMIDNTDKVIPSDEIETEK